MFILADAIPTPLAVEVPGSAWHCMRRLFPSEPGPAALRGRWCAGPRGGNSRRAAGGYSLSSAQCKRLEGGLDKLKEASIQLDELNRKLAEQKIVLAEKSTACEALLDEIVTNTAIGECGPGRVGHPTAGWPHPEGWAFLGHRCVPPISALSSCDLFPLSDKDTLSK